MIRLSDSEIDCLRRIADEPSATPSCPDDVLKRLQDLELVRLESQLWAPVEAIDLRYYVTASGADLLKRLDARPESDCGKEDE